MKKAMAGGLLAGLVLLIWGWISHEVLPFGEAGLRSVPAAGEAAIVAALRGSLRERALYVLPGMDRSQMTRPGARKAWLDRYLAGPSGVLAPVDGGDGRSDVGNCR